MPVPSDTDRQIPSTLLRDGEPAGWPGSAGPRCALGQVGTAWNAASAASAVSVAHETWHSLHDTDEDAR